MLSKLINEHRCVSVNRILLPVMAAFMVLLAGTAAALELPAPDQLKNSVRSQSLSVIEPHISTTERPVAVGYAGFPINELLTLWFGESWKAPDSEVVFFARDGYRSAIKTERLQRFHAYLAYARSDGSAFEVDNPSQNQKHIALGPYYLIWDNRAEPELLRQGGYGWPYQVVRIKLHKIADERTLLPPNPSAETVRGYAETKDNCLTCHRIKGLGGEKYPEDLLQAACRWTDANLKVWIDDPKRIRPGTSMPPLSATVPVEQRSAMIDRIVRYLDSMQPDGSAACAR